MHLWCVCMWRCVCGRMCVLSTVRSTRNFKVYTRIHNYSWSRSARFHESPDLKKTLWLSCQPVTNTFNLQLLTTELWFGGITTQGVGFFPAVSLSFLLHLYLLSSWRDASLLIHRHLPPQWAHCCLTSGPECLQVTVATVWVPCFVTAMRSTTLNLSLRIKVLGEWIV